MKSFGKILCLMFALGPTFASAQNQYIKNVIVVIQENRTPDNLFYAICAGGNCGTGASQFNLASGGSCLDQGTDYNVPLKALSLKNCSDPGHLHRDWISLYNGGGMDGACSDSAACAPPTGFLHPCPQLPPPASGWDCTRYSYVDNSTLAIQPYLDLATQYGWAKA